MGGHRKLEFIDTSISSICSYTGLTQNKQTNITKTKTNKNKLYWQQHHCLFLNVQKN